MKHIPFLIVLALSASLCKFTGHIGNNNNNNNNGNAVVTNGNEANMNASPTTTDSPDAENTPGNSPTPQTGANDTGGIEQGEVEQALISIKRQWCEAIIASDPEANRRVLADEFVNTDPRGQTTNREQFIQQLGQPSPGATYSIDEPRLISNNLTTAIMTYIVTFKYKGETQRIRDTDTFVKREGRWQIVSSASSPAAGGGRRR